MTSHEPSLPSPTSPLTDGSYVFDLDAGRVCLDFVNTLGFSSGDHLMTYADLVSFAAQAQLLPPVDAEWLLDQATREPAAAQAVLGRARRLRTALRAVFSSLAAAQQPADAQLDILNEHLATSLTYACVLPVPGEGYAWGWRDRTLEAPIWPIARSAADLLVSQDERPALRECGASDCMWLFLDTSKNRTRQWCSMQTCGNREKARRHYQRVRASRDEKA